MKTSILIVDDSKTSRLFIRQALEMIGFQSWTFFEAANGLEAIASIRQNGPSTLLVTDINMPEMGGIELIRRLREEQLDAGVRIVVISSTQSTLRDASLKEMGVSAILEKPISIPKIMAIFADSLKGA